MNNYGVPLSAYEKTFALITVFQVENVQAFAAPVPNTEWRKPVYIERSDTL